MVTRLTVTDSLFEVISEEEFQAETSVPSDDQGEASEGTMTYCEFCKGYYNEYHYGEPEGGE